MVYKINIFMVMTHPSLSPRQGILTGIKGQSGKIMCQGGKPDTGGFTHLILVCGSAYENVCVVDGMCAMAAD